MLDNLRDDEFTKPFFEDDAPLPEPEPDTLSKASRNARFLGMTPFQRFVISVMLMMVICLLGSLFLLATGRIGLYF